MDLDLLQTFLEVAGTGHFGRAAERLHLTQSTVSARVRLLEEELGQKLFLRERSGAQLSPAGQAFSKQAARMLALWEEAKLQANPQAPEKLTLNVAGAPAALALFGGVWMRAWADAEPSGSLRLYSQPQPAPSSEWNLSLGFELPKGAGLEVVQLAEVELGLAVGDTEGERRFLALDWGSAHRASLQRKHPELIPARWSLDQPQAALELLQAQGGSAYLPLSWAERLGPGLSFRDDPCETVPLVGAFRKKTPLTDAARRALDLLLQALNGGDCGRSGVLG